MQSSGAWTAVSNTGIGTIEPSSGSAGFTQVLFKPGVNMTNSSRNGTLTFTCGNASSIVTWTQSGVVEVESPISVSPTSVTFAGDGSTSARISIKCEGAWTSSSGGWATVSPTSGSGDSSQLMVTVSRNPSSVERSTTITFYYGSYQAVFTAIQLGN